MKIDIESILLELYQEAEICGEILASRGMFIDDAHGVFLEDLFVSLDFMLSDKTR